MLLHTSESYILWEVGIAIETVHALFPDLPTIQFDHLQYSKKEGEGLAHFF